jgi:cytochrome c5
MKRQLVILTLIIASLVSVQCGGSPPATEAPAATEPPATEEAPVTLDGKSLVEERCTRCHDLGPVEAAKKTEEEWKTTVERMVGKGAQLDQTEQELVIKYLTETLAQIVRP